MPLKKQNEPKGHPNRRELEKLYGNPDKFACSVFLAVPGYISVDEADIAIKKYKKEWAEAPND